MDITQLLAFVMQNNASDLHLSANNPPIVRVYGTLKRLKAEPLTNEDIRGMLYSIMTDDQRAEYEKNLELDFAISFGEKARFRVNSFTNRNGSAAVFRTIPSVVPTMEELDLPPIMRRFAELEKGIILVTGPTGSGKSTTLASMINHINETMPKHILTVEDPVEFFHTSKKALINHRELGTDTHSFSRALKSALREDPDVILVGEMRDHETISLALTAAETGHLVFGTLHSNSASKTIDRIIDVFPTGDKEMIRAMLSSSLQGVVAQTLMKRKGGEGRVAAFEVLVGTNAVRNLIRENQIPQMYSMIQTGSRYGMITMEDSIESLLDQGIVDEDEARAALMKATDEEGGDRDAGMATAAKGGGGHKKGGASNDPQENINADEGYSF
ncbi:MAG: type IV pilus twitching motility protein PilT [Pseudobdellovibrionaceae bacterium]|jgi:twitching motility protein PilT|nr:type IV pilus twitching motility protein PilT [Pseudobdellovibrionaceae bacterium]